MPLLVAALLAMQAPSVQWSAPAGCPTHAEVVALVEDNLAGVDPAVVDDVQSEATVEATDAGTWRVSIVVNDGEARALEVDSCDAAAEAVALSIAIALGEGAQEEPAVVPPPEVVEPPPVEPEPPPVLPVAEPTAREPEPESESEPRSDPRVRGFIGAEGGAGFGILPPGGQLTLRGGLLGRRWLVTGGAHHWVRRAVRLPEDDGAGSNVSATTGFIAAGPRWTFGVLELPVLGGVELGAMRARGIGASEPRTRNVVWAVGLVGAGLTIAPLRRLAITVRAEAVIPFVQHTFVFLETVEVVETGPVGGRALAGLQLRLP